MNSSFGIVPARRFLKRLPVRVSFRAPSFRFDVPRGTRRAQPDRCPTPQEGKESRSMSTIQKPKSRLGRGLSSLLSVADLPVEAEVPQLELPDTVLGDAANSGAASAASDTRPATVPTEIAVDRISPNPHQPRRQMND